MQTYIMRDCADWPSKRRRRLTPAGLFWLGYVVGIAGIVAGFVFW